MSDILPLAVGSSYSDELGEVGDILYQGYYYDIYNLTGLTADVPLTINMSSSNMNTWIAVYNVDAQEFVGSDDDSGSGFFGTDAKFTFIPKPGDNYQVYASSSGLGSTGYYSISASV